MKASFLNRRIFSIISIVICASMLLCLTGCNVETKIAGKYVGSHGTFINLGLDGSCFYAEDDDTGSGLGSWYIKDNKIYIYSNALGYTIYGDISNDDGFLLESDSSSWNDEYFSPMK